MVSMRGGRNTPSISVAHLETEAKNLWLVWSFDYRKHPRPAYFLGHPYTPMDSELPWLEFRSGERVFLTSTCSIGRGPENRVVIPVDCVSRRHAVLRLGDDSRWTLVDMGSSNGTYLNGQRISQ